MFRTSSHPTTEKYVSFVVSQRSDGVTAINRAAFCEVKGGCGSGVGSYREYFFAPCVGPGAGKNEEEVEKE